VVVEEVAGHVLGDDDVAVALSAEPGGATVAVIAGHAGISVIAAYHVGLVADR
jgi:hypothetical protein